MKSVHKSVKYAEVSVEWKNLSKSRPQNANISLCLTFEDEFEVKECSYGSDFFLKEFLKSIHYVNGSYDVCIFDVMMPNMDGFALTEKIRARGSRTPIIFLTAKKMKEDMIKGYQVGGDDYLNKPFDIEILLLKLDAIFSRQGQGQAEKQEDRYSLGNYAK